MNEFEIRCYGMSTNDIREQYMNSLTARLSGLEMVVMGIMSDCQELMTMKNHDYPSDGANRYDEQIRKQMNIAKYILSEMMEQRDQLLAANSKKIHKVAA